MATFATKALPVIGAGIDVVSNIVENIAAQERNRKFEKSKEDLREGISETFYEVMQMLDSDDSYIDQFAPSYRILENQIRQDEEDIRNQESMLQKFIIWNKEIIDADYRIVW